MNNHRTAKRVAVRELAQQYAGLISQDMEQLSDDSLCGLFWAELVSSGPLAEMLSWTPRSSDSMGIAGTVSGPDSLVSFKEPSP